MKIFCDTNIITEFLEKRLLFDAVAKILTLASTSHTLFLSEGGFYTITFLVDKQLRRMSIYSVISTNFCIGYSKPLRAAPWISMTSPGFRTRSSFSL